MPDYSKGKIYKLVSDKTDKIYVGSTCDTLNERFSSHNGESNDCSSRKLFVDGATVSIELIEDFPCETKNELKIRERYHIENNDCINEKIPHISDLQGGTVEYRAEYDSKRYVENKEAILKKHLEHYADNKEAILKQKAEYYKDNKVEISKKKAEYYKDNKEAKLKQATEYYSKNKDKISKRMAEYSAKNKDKISKRRAEAYAKKKLTASLDVGDSQSL